MSEKNNRFQDFFDSPTYIGFKNLFYNYRLRKHCVTKHYQNVQGLTLEIGSGVSPMVTGQDTLVHTDLSFSAMQMLRMKNPISRYVVADAMQLPFRDGVFENLICSEVLEHLEDDEKCIRELARVIRPTGRLILTFPHRRCYYASDDRYVAHYRRYELGEMRQRLHSSGFRIRHVEKVLGLLDKVTMLVVIRIFTWVEKFENCSRLNTTRSLPEYLYFSIDFLNLFYAGFVWLDARLMPISTASVLLVMAEKEEV